MTSYIIPCLLAFVTLFALGQKIDVYNALVRGAENGLNVTFRIVPSLVALLTGVSMLRASGALDCLTALLSPLMNAAGITKTRYTIPAAVIADLAAFLASVLAVHLFFGL